jgi:hypothetical protein
MTPAAHCRRDKEQHPELYCRTKGCLWRVVTNRGPNPCRNHPVDPFDCREHYIHRVDGTVAGPFDSVSEMMRNL